MALNDVLPWDSANGGTSRANVGYITASQTFEMGEPVFVTLAGTISVAPDAMAADTLLGIAGGGPGTANTNPYTGTTTWGVGTRVPIWIPTPGDKFITPNYAASTAGDFGGTAPVVAQIGDFVGLEGIGGDYGIVADGVKLCRVYDILNSNKDSIRITGETLTASTTKGSYYVVFEIIAHQSMPVTGLAETPGA